MEKLLTSAQHRNTANTVRCTEKTKDLFPDSLLRGFVFDQSSVDHQSRAGSCVIHSGLRARTTFVGATLLVHLIGFRALFSSQQTVDSRLDPLVLHHRIRHQFQRHRSTSKLVFGIMAPECPMRASRKSSDLFIELTMLAIVKLVGLA